MNLQSTETWVRTAQAKSERSLKAANRINLMLTNLRVGVYPASAEGKHRDLKSRAVGGKLLSLNIIESCRHLRHPVGPKAEMQSECPL